MGKETTIETFDGWENASQQHDFFGETNLEAEVITTKEPAEKTPEEKEKEAEIKKEEQEIEDQFKSFEAPAALDKKEVEEEEEQELRDKGTKGAVSKMSNKETLEFLKEKGFVKYELEEGEELTEDRAAELAEDGWEASVQEGIEETIKELPDLVKDLIRVASKGGDVYDVISQVAKSSGSGITKSSDISKEDVQVRAVQLELAGQGHDQDYIDTHIEFLKEKGKLEDIGTKAYNKIIKAQEETSSNEAKRVAKSAEDRKTAARTYKTGLSSHISSLNEVGGLPLSKADKSELPSYISDPTVQLEDGRVISELQADIFKVMADKDKIVLLAKVLKSDFDFSAISRKQKTEAAKEMRTQIENAESIKNKSEKTKSNRPVWEMLD